jgi:hypothetical protein
MARFTSAKGHGNRSGALPTNRWLAFAASVLVVSLPLHHAEAQTAGGMLGDQYIPSDGIAAIVVSPAELMSSEATELYPWEIAEAWCLDNVGFSPKICDSVRLVTASPGPSGPMAAVVVKLNQPFKVESLNPQLIRLDESVDVDGYKCYAIAGPPGVVFHQPDDKTIIVASTNYLESVMDAADGGQQSQLCDLSKVVKHDGHATVVLAIEPIRPMVNGMLQAFANQLPPPIQPFAELPNLLDAVLIRLNLDDSDAGAQLAMLAVDDASAEKIESLVDDAVQMGRGIAMAQLQQNIRDEGPVPDATMSYADRIADRIAGLAKPERNGKRLLYTASPGEGIMSQAVLLGMLAPAISGVRRAGPRRNVARMGVANQMKQLGLAMHNYHSAYRKLPDAVNRDAAGKPLLSWRVHVLPFIEEQALYQEFHLDEPWDSEHNIKLLPRMPQLFEHASFNVAEGKTVFQVPVGEEVMFSTDQKRSFRDITDGLSNTIMIVQSNAESAVEWSKPSDVSFDLDSPAESLGFVDGQTGVIMGDGAWIQHDQGVDAEQWKAMLTHAARD